ncbi:hypothetical protein ACIQNU_32740 [Streptomyces sp. NPDC091292]|uniref:hypothetical protein n=1 Tax=Streptomyces sp. NPDC091292 TaxID=3365991 RepID=UPI003800C948
MGVHRSRGFRVCIGAAALLTAFSASACVRGTAGGEAERMRDALQPLHDAGSFRMAGKLRAADGTTTAFNALLDGRGNCKGTLGAAESLLVGERVWTRWEDAALPDAVSSLNGGPLDPVDPTADQSEDKESAVMKLLRGAYMVTALPADNHAAGGIAPVCQAGALLADAGSGTGDVTSDTVVEGSGERLQQLSRATGPVTVRVLVPADGEPTVRRAEYSVDGGRSLTATFTDLGAPLTVSFPRDAATVASADVLALLD